MISTLNLNNQDKIPKEQKYPKTVFGLKKKASKTIENEQKNSEDQKKKLTEKLKRGRMRNRKLMLEKQTEIEESKMNMKKRIKVFEDVFASKRNKIFNNAYMQYNTNE